MNGFIINAAMKEKSLSIWGVLENGNPFEWITDQAYHIAFVNPLSEQLPSFKFQQKVKGKAKTLQGNPLDLYYFENRAQLLEAERSYDKKNFYESDLDPELRFLMEKKLFGAICFKSEPTLVENDVYIYENPVVHPSTYIPKIKFLSFDIENSVKDDILYSISIHTEKDRKVLMLAGSTGRDIIEKYNGEEDALLEYYTSEKDIIDAFCSEVARINPQAFIGWNVVGYDFRYLHRKSKELGTTFNLGVGRTEVDAFIRKQRDEFSIKIPGRACLDGIPILRGLGYRFKRWGLDFVGNELLGRGKLISPNEDKLAEIEHDFRHDKKRLAKYNLVDSELVTEIFKHCSVENKLVYRQLINGCFFERQPFTNDWLDFLYLPVLHRAGYAAGNSLKKESEEEQIPYSRSVSGNYSKVGEFKIPLFEPSIVQMFGLDPLSRFLVGDETPAYNGFDEMNRYHKTKTILPGILENLRKKIDLIKNNEQLEALEAVYTEIATAFSANYGRFLSPVLTNSLAANIEGVMKKIINDVENEGYPIVFAGPGVLYAAIPEEIPQEKWTTEILAAIQKSVGELCSERDLENLLTAEYSDLWTQFFVPYRENKEGLYYAGKKGESELIVKGAPLTGQAWCRGAEQFRELIAKSLFEEESPLEFCKGLKAKVQNGEYDDLLIYTGRMRQTMEEYEQKEKLPPHVVAAKQFMEVKGEPLHDKRVFYVMTTGGPEHEQTRNSPIDYVHYFESQLTKIAEQVLGGSDYEKAIDQFKKNEAQLSLFDF